ncbi:MAG: protein of unknown function rane [Mucilaginibacter sp.]|jgi:uncharacterized membrane protein HdeD (DUF308 family)|nr:protein of unknown function rane [Mucilaginibacter sp.]MDB5138770.1 protein of unknown function rane [Mucilaginibacter sp.]
MEIITYGGLRHWWVFVLRGVLFILVGIYMLMSPATGFVALGLLFGLVILVAGVTELLHAYRDHGRDSKRWHLLAGLVEVVLGIVLMTHVAASIDIIRIIVGIYFLFRGISILTFRRMTGRSWWVTLGGVLVLIFGLLVLFNPAFGALTIVLWTAIAFIVTGIVNVLLGISMRPAS